MNTFWDSIANGMNCATCKHLSDFVSFPYRVRFACERDGHVIYPLPAKLYCEHYKPKEPVAFAWLGYADYAKIKTEASSKDSKEE